MSDLEKGFRGDDDLTVDELSVDELDDVAGGTGDTNNGCNFAAGCGVAAQKPSIT